MKGLLVSFYRPASGSGCSNGGVSDRCKSAILIGPKIPEIFPVTEDHPALELVIRDIGGRKYVHAQPVEGRDPKCIGWMFGGNFIYTSDGRFPSDYPIPVHDRQESQELNKILSR